MTRTRFTPWIVLACIGTLAACSSDGGGPAGNTELNVIIDNGANNGSSAPAPIDVQSVEYTIVCDGNSDVFLDSNTPGPGPVTLNGNLEVDDNSDPEVWQGFMDIPPGECRVQLRARDGDGEVICSGDNLAAMDRTVDGANDILKVNIILICQVSFQAPVGQLDVDGTFSFVVGNLCPDLFVLSCLETEVTALGPPLPPLVVTECETRYRDDDDGCGEGCDPQDCDENPTTGLLDCEPGPDPGLSTTVTCVSSAPAGANAIDCDANPATPETECSWSGDVLGSLQQQPHLPNGVLTGAPVPDGTFFIACDALDPGATITCTATTTDGDLDCNKTKTFEATCPGLTPCGQFFADGGTCDDANECTADSCDDLLGPDCSGGVCCVNDAAANDGNSCDPGVPGPGVCNGGVCEGQSCAAQPDPDAACDDGNECTTNTCDLGTGNCNTVNVGAGTSCSGGTGECDGNGMCIDNCTGVDCSDGNDCTQDVCDSAAGGVCSNPAESADTPCDPGTGNPGLCDGAGTCVEQVCVPAAIDDTALTACRNSFNNAVSTFPIDISGSTDVCPEPGNSFNADLTPTLNLSTDFLTTAAQALCDLTIVLSEATLNTVQVQIDSTPDQGTSAGTPVGADCSGGALSEAPSLPQVVPVDITIDGACGSGGIATVNSPISFGLPQVSLACNTTGASGEVVAFCADGVTPGSVLADDIPVDTYVEVGVSLFNVDFACGVGQSDPGNAGDATDVVATIDPTTDCPTQAID